jgi:ABC-type dipeptide/oligopeptide/nickel transport system permease component
VALVGVSVPVFWMGFLLMIVFALELGWLPASGRGTWRHLVLPAVTVGSRRRRSSLASRAAR